VSEDRGTPFRDGPEDCSETTTEMMMMMMMMLYLFKEFSKES